MFRRASSRADSNSPLCACNDPQQCCSPGVTTSQPFRASTSTVSRFHVAENQVLRATYQHCQPGISFWPTARVTGAIKSADHSGLHRRRHGLQFPAAASAANANPAAPHQRLQPQFLV